MQGDKRLCYTKAENIQKFSLNTGSAKLVKDCTYFPHTFLGIVEYIKVAFFIAG
jgi:hypothetical protein